MFNRFLQLQQQELENLGGQKQTMEQRHHVEQERYQALKFFHQNLGQHAPDHHGTTALSFQNRYAMRDQLGVLLDSQEQELTVAKLELDSGQQALLRQYGKVRGLNRLVEKKKQSERQNERRQEQRQQDDWLNGSRHRTS